MVVCGCSAHCCPRDQGRVRYGELERESQKAITAICRKKPTGTGCVLEMGAFLRCLKRSDFDTSACVGEAEALEKCSQTPVTASVRNAVPHWSWRG